MIKTIQYPHPHAQDQQKGRGQGIMIHSYVEGDINTTIRKLALHKNMSISATIRGLIVEGMSHDDNIGIDEDGNLFFDPKM